MSSRDLLEADLSRDASSVQWKIIEPCREPVRAEQLLIKKQSAFLTNIQDSKFGSFRRKLHNDITE